MDLQRIAVGMGLKAWEHRGWILFALIIIFLYGLATKYIGGPFFPGWDLWSGLPIECHDIFCEMRRGG